MYLDSFRNCYILQIMQHLRCQMSGTSAFGRPGVVSRCLYVWIRYHMNSWASLMPSLCYHHLMVSAFRAGVA
jgi:hypothetical protein